MFFSLKSELAISLFQTCVRFQSVALFVTLYDGNSVTWGTRHNVEVDLERRSTNVMSIELEGSFSTASKIQIEYTHKDILCLEKLQLESIDNATTFDLIQVIKMFY